MEGTLIKMKKGIKRNKLDGKEEEEEEEEEEVKHIKS
jgi:hypothetical protein